MSYTEIFKFNKQGDAERCGEVKNSWRGAMAVWGILEKKYLPKYVPEYAKFFREPDKEYSRCADVYGRGLQEIWDLAHNDKVSRTDKICLMSTFDNVTVPRENIPELLKAFREFEGETSLKEQADEIEAALSNDPELIAIAWNQTSVNGDAWESDTIAEDEDGDEYYPPYNILNENKHWSLFEEEF